MIARKISFREKKFFLKGMEHIRRLAVPAQFRRRGAFIPPRTQFASERLRRCSGPGWVFLKKLQQADF